MSPANKRKTLIKRYETDAVIEPEAYTEYIGRERVDELKRLAEPLQGRGWANINSTFMGGGVAEMLQGVIPLARQLGINAHWYVIHGNDAFFQVTKKFHNMLQGIDQPITLEEIFGAYIDTINENARKTLIASDMVVVHDPQPAAIIMNGMIFGRVLWRCHIDTSAPNQIVLRFLLPYINQCSGAIFTMPEFVAPGIQIPVYQIMPCIDPLAIKNRQVTDTEALDILAPLFNEHNIDPQRPIFAAVSRYDVHKNQTTVLKAFQTLRKNRKHDPSPYLIFLGNTATDDPEGGVMLEMLKQQAGDDADVRFWVNVENNDRVVGALMHIARSFIHISTREGFGLVVSEALWQGTPVIGSSTGGIVMQVVDGRTGFVVMPLDEEAVAARMAWILDHPDHAAGLGSAGREHVRDNFLLPELVRRYLLLLRFYTGAQLELPQFRLDELSYSDIMHAVRPRHPGLP